MNAVAMNAEQERLVPRRTPTELGLALFNLSQTERRIAHRYRQWALEAERDGHRSSYLHHIGQARRYWREAVRHFDKARIELKGV